MIGDDGSTDGSWELIQSKYGANENIKMYRMPRDDSMKEFSNWRHSRLICFLLNKSRGEYISILDGDDLYCSRDGFKRKIKLLESDQNKDCIACTSAAIFKTLDQEVPQKIPDSLILKKLTLKQVFFSKERFYFHIATCVFRRSVLKYINFNEPELFGADQAILDFILHYGKLYVTPGYDFKYRILPNSIWHKGNDEEHAVRMAIGFNIAWRKYGDLYFRRLWKDRKSLLYVYRNKKVISKRIDWEMWKGFVDKYNLEFVKWLMGDNNVSLKVKIEMRGSILLLSILSISPAQKCKYFVERIQYLFSGSVPVSEKKKRTKEVINKSVSALFGKR